MPRGSRVHIADVDFPIGGTLVQEERDYIFARTGCKPAVRYRESWGRRAMSMLGEIENLNEDQPRHQFDMWNYARKIA